MKRGLIIGYDPGGADSHGMAALQVQEHTDRWVPMELWVGTAHSLNDVVAWLTDACWNGRIVAAGVDTLTAWNSGPGGWRPADLWLRRTYPGMAKSVVSPNSIYGSMAVNGAAFLTLLGPRFRTDATVVTEAHPKVCYFALTGRTPAWSTDREEMAGWLTDELGIQPTAGIGDGADHRFDAAMAVLASLRGLNREWTLDLHALPGVDQTGQVRFCGDTHYWWPD